MINDSKQISKLLKEVSTMPSVKHHHKGESYDVMKSEAIDWLVKQPGVREWLWRKVMATKLIEYDEAFEVWKGIGIERAGQIVIGQKGRPKKWVPEILGKWIEKRIGKSASSAQLKVHCCHELKMAEPTYYRMRNLAEAKKIIFYDSAADVWKHSTWNPTTDSGVSDEVWNILVAEIEKNRQAFQHPMDGAFLSKHRVMNALKKILGETHPWGNDDDDERYEALLTGRMVSVPVKGRGMGFVYVKNPALNHPPVQAAAPGQSPA